MAGRERERMQVVCQLPHWFLQGLLGDVKSHFCFLKYWVDMGTPPRVATKSLLWTYCLGLGN